MGGKRKEKEGGDVERLSHLRKTWKGGFATNGPVCEQLKTQKPHVCLGACRTHMDTYVILFQGTDWGITEEFIVPRGQLASWKAALARAQSLLSRYGDTGFPKLTQMTTRHTETQHIRAAGETKELLTLGPPMLKLLNW